MNSLPETILKTAKSLSEGGVLSPKEFLHLGSRAAVDQAFSRLTKAGKLMRIQRGTYVTPVESRFGSRAPTPEKVVRAMAHRQGETVVPHGAMAANALGLTQQVPFKEAYFTSGRSRKLRFGKYEIAVKHVPSWMLALGEGQAGAAVRALSWLGKAHAQESVSQLHSRLAAEEWNALNEARSVLPSWMAQAIGAETTVVRA